MYIPSESMPSNQKPQREPKRLTFSDKTWQDNDWVEYYGSDERLTVCAGLLWSSGLERGLYFSADRTIRRTETRFAAALAHNEGLILVIGDAYKYLRD